MAGSLQRGNREIHGDLVLLLRPALPKADSACAICHRVYADEIRQFGDYGAMRSLAMWAVYGRHGYGPSISFSYSPSRVGLLLQLKHPTSSHAEVCATHSPDTHFQLHSVLPQSAGLEELDSDWELLSDDDSDELDTDGELLSEDDSNELDSDGELLSLGEDDSDGELLSDDDGDSDELDSDDDELLSLEDDSDELDSDEELLLPGVPSIHQRIPRRVGTGHTLTGEPSGRYSVSSSAFQMRATTY